MAMWLKPLKIASLKFHEILHEGRAISTEVDFGHPRHDQFEFEIKVDIAIYTYRIYSYFPFHGIKPVLKKN